MYFTKIRLNGVSYVDLPIIGAAPSDTFIMKGADGLGPVEVVVTILNGVYQGSQPQDRQVVLRVGLNANYGINQTPEQLRTTLYNLLGLRGDIPLRMDLMNGTTVVGIMNGYISKIEPVIFAKDPEVQITIDCVGSYIYAPAEIAFVPTAKTAFDVPNVGSAPVGFIFTARSTASFGSFRLSRTSDPTDYIDLDYDFIPNDLIVFDTRENFLDAVVIRDDTFSTNLIAYTSLGREWPKLYPGTNNFTTSNTGFNWGSIDFTPQYWGI